MAIVKIPAGRITDWATFHDIFAEALGFPGFYGRNMNAWIDCLSHIDDPDAGMTTMTIAPGEVLTLQLEGIDRFARRCPEQFDALVECSAFVNWRRIEAGEHPVIALSFYKASPR